MLQFRLSTMITATMILAVQFSFFREATAECLGFAIGVMAILTIVIGGIAIFACESQDGQIKTESNLFIPPLLRILKIVLIYGLLNMVLLVFLGPGGR